MTKDNCFILYFYITIISWIFLWTVSFNDWKEVSRAFNFTYFARKCACSLPCIPQHQSFYWNAVGFWRLVIVSHTGKFLLPSCLLDCMLSLL